MEEDPDPMAKAADGTRGRGGQPLPRPHQALRHALLRAADLLPPLCPHRVVGAGCAATVAALLQWRLPQCDVLQKRVVAAVVVAIGGCADVLPQKIAGLRIARVRAVEFRDLIL